MTRNKGVKVWEKVVAVELQNDSRARSFLAFASETEVGVVLPLPEPSPHPDPGMQEAVDLLPYAAIAQESKVDLHYRGDLKLVFS